MSHETTADDNNHLTPESPVVASQQHHQQQEDQMQIDGNYAVTTIPISGMNDDTELPRPSTTESNLPFSSPPHTNRRRLPDYEAHRAVLDRRRFRPTPSNHVSGAASTASSISSVVVTSTMGSIEDAEELMTSSPHDTMDQYETPIVSNRRPPRRTGLFPATTPTDCGATQLSQRKLKQLKQEGGSDSTVATTAIESTTRLVEELSLGPDLPVVVEVTGPPGALHPTPPPPPPLPPIPGAYYRITYRGVVALLSTPEPNAERNNSYLSYGDIIRSNWETEQEFPILKDDRDYTESRFDPHAPFPPSRHPGIVHSPDSTTTSITANSITSNHATIIMASSPDDGAMSSPLSPKVGQRKLIRVDDILTGGYAIVDIIGTTKCEGYGFLPSHLGPHTLLEPIERSYIPTTEVGKFFYKVISSSPLPILAGPCIDAPKSQAMALPGSVQEACLRLVYPDGRVFLRLHHRRGWILEHRITKTGLVAVVQLLSHASPDESIDCDSSVLSSVTTLSVTTMASLSRRRHRPPRKRADAMPEVLPKIRVSVILPKHHPDNHPSKRLNSPLSNVSLLSDDSSLDHHSASLLNQSQDVSLGTTATRSLGSPPTPTFYLMRVVAPGGLKILDAPQFQVNNLIHGGVSSSHMVSQVEHTKNSNNSHHQHHSIFQTMAGRTTGPSRTGNPAIFDSSSKTRILPRGVLFEAARRMESLISAGSFRQGAGLIKLSDNSGWAIVPKPEELEWQYRKHPGLLANVMKESGDAPLQAFEEVGQAIIDEATIWLRIVVRSGVPISCPPAVSSSSLLSATSRDNDHSPTSSRGSSTVAESDVVSSVGSAFLDAMFRTPKKRTQQDGVTESTRVTHTEKSLMTTASTIVACGVCVEVERWSPNDHGPKQEFARIRGGQGWIPLRGSGKVLAMEISKPEFRFGSFWFRVQSSKGIKARQGPSRRAPSVKSDDGSHTLRFECGEFLRASEIMTVFSVDGNPMESFAKLYRNRHVNLYRGHESFRPYLSITAAAEWVPVYEPGELFLEECAQEPRIERHREGWRYNVVFDQGVAIRRGPSFAAETTGSVLLGGESVLIVERVIPAGEKITWLRLKDGSWVHDTDDKGTELLIAHSLIHRIADRPKKALRGSTHGSHNEAAYNAIVSRLFHNEDEDRSLPRK